MILKLPLIDGNSGMVVNRFLSRTTVFLVLVFTMINSNCLAQTRCPSIMIDMVLGEPVPWDDVLDDLAKSRIIYLGEHHTIARHHRFQLDVIRGLAERGISLAIGMEMFSTGHQTVLNEWFQTDSGIDELVRKLGPERWNNLTDYAELLNYAKKIKSPIIGLNASDSVVRKVAKDGLEALSQSEQQTIPNNVRQINPQYEKLLRLKLRVHKSFQGKKLDRIILAQAVRDSVMANSVVEYLSSDRGEGKTMIVIAGSGHLNYGFGIPERVCTLLDVPHRIALPSESGELVLTEKELRHSVPLEITHSDLIFIKVRIADYLSVLPLSDAEKTPAPELIQAGIR